MSLPLPAPSAMQNKVLSAFEETGVDYFLPFKSIAQRSGVPQHLVRRTVRALARKGYLRYARGLWSDDGEPGGSGYGLTDAGCEFLDAELERELAKRGIDGAAP